MSEPKITDPTTLARLAKLIAPALKRQAERQAKESRRAA